jgi:hypothetical protein
LTVTPALIVTVTLTVCPVLIAPLCDDPTEPTKGGPIWRSVAKLEAAERSAALPLVSAIVAPLKVDLRDLQGRRLVGRADRIVEHQRAG